MTVVVVGKLVFYFKHVKSPPHHSVTLTCASPPPPPPDPRYFPCMLVNAAHSIHVQGPLRCSLCTSVAQQRGSSGESFVCQQLVPHLLTLPHHAPRQPRFFEHDEIRLKALIELLASVRSISSFQGSFVSLNGLIVVLMLVR